jgi:hypothetical protein
MTDDNKDSIVLGNSAGFLKTYYRILKQFAFQPDIPVYSEEAIEADYDVEEHVLLSLAERKVLSKFCEYGVAAGGGVAEIVPHKKYRFVLRTVDDYEVRADGVEPSKRGMKASLEFVHDKNNSDNSKWTLRVFGTAGDHLLLIDDKSSVKFQRVDGADTNDFFVSQEQMKCLFDNQDSESWTLVDPVMERFGKLKLMTSA